MAKPRDSFEEFIPSRLCSLGDDALKGVIVFDVSGASGGVWTVDGHRRTVAVGKAQQVDFTVHISAEDWEHLTQDPHQVLALHFSKRLTFEGNPHFLTKLKMLLS